MKVGTRIRDGWRSVDRVMVVDSGIAVLLFAFMALELSGKQLQSGESASNAVAYLMSAAITLPFAVHRRYPVAVLTIATWATVIYSIGRFSAFPGYALFVLLFGISLHADRRRSTAALAAVVTAISVALVLQPAGVVTSATWISTMLAVTVAWLSGENIRSRRIQVEVLEDRARRMDSEREDRGRRAVTEERLRIARELHDVVAHSMSVIAVQAGVANHVIDSRPELARQALATVETNTRAALVEMRRLLGVLRDPTGPGDGRGGDGRGSDGHGRDPTAGLAPAPGLAQVPALIEQFAEAGLHVELRVEGPGGVPEAGLADAAVPQAGVRQAGVPEVAGPDGVDLSAYRIVQEGLTNVLRHGGPRAEVTIIAHSDVIRVEVCDDGHQANPVEFSAVGSSADTSRADGRRFANGSGHGLVGMRERVAVFGGTLAAGPRPEGGFRVVATLPFGAPAPSRRPLRTGVSVAAGSGAAGSVAAGSVAAGSVTAGTP